MYIYIWDETCIAHIYRELSDALRERWDHIKQHPKRKGGVLEMQILKSRYHPVTRRRR